MHQDSEYDKYKFKNEVRINCQSRLHICKAVCCRFPFALSRPDVAEGIINWEFGRPYLIAHGEDGYCVYLDREDYRCTVWEQRPVPCRGFDCKYNEKWKVWVNYEKRVVNHELMERINESNEKIYSIPELRSTSNRSTLWDETYIWASGTANQIVLICLYSCNFFAFALKICLLPCQPNPSLFYGKQ